MLLTCLNTWGIPFQVRLVLVYGRHSFHNVMLWTGNCFLGYSDHAQKLFFLPHINGTASLTDSVSHRFVSSSQKVWMATLVGISHMYEKNLIFSGMARSQNCSHTTLCSVPPLEGGIIDFLLQDGNWARTWDQVGSKRRGVRMIPHCIF